MIETDLLLFYFITALADNTNASWTVMTTSNLLPHSWRRHFSAIMVISELIDLHQYAGIKR